jgi:hypothetical protein
MFMLRKKAFANLRYPSTNEVMHLAEKGKAF